MKITHLKKIQRNSIKISYSCTSNCTSKIIPLNYKILNKNNINDKSKVTQKINFETAAKNLAL